MRNLLPVKGHVLSTLFAFVCLSISLITFGQSPPISQFVIFCGHGGPGTTVPASGVYGVQIGSSITVSGGSVGSYSFVQTTGNASILSNIYSNGSISLTNSNVVSGHITAANLSGASGNILSVGSSANITGNINVNGNILIGGGAVNGTVTHPAGTSYSGPVPTGGENIGTPSLPTLPALPSITSFPAAGDTDITNTRNIAPGQYRNVTYEGNKTLTLNGPGVYVFNSFHFTGNSNKIVFNFQGTSVGNFYIYIHGDGDFGKLNASISNGGSAARIYTEVHGNGMSTAIPGYSFIIANGSSGGGSKWMGTVWAPYAGINIGSGTGSSQLSGAMYSATQVNIQSGVTLTHASFQNCTTPVANAGTDITYSCPVVNVQLQGVSSIVNGSYNWTTSGKGVILSGAQTATPAVFVNGTDSTQTAVFTLTVTDPNGNCSATDQVSVKYNACVFPAITSVGKTTTIIGSELTSLYNNPNQETDGLLIVTDNNTRVMIEIIAVAGQQNSLYNLLTTNTALYGLTDTIGNSLTPLIITGSYPIANLLNLNALTSQIVYARPLYSVINNTGLINSQGDVAMHTDFVREAYSIAGDSVLIGVISDSYNKRDGAATDIANGDLPGPANPNGYTTPITIVKEYPFSGGSDEGRAMLQIVHDVAPAAPLAFRTGFLTAGDFATGIIQLKDLGCKVVVDDVTFITESFYQDGIVAQTVDQVVSQGVSYFTAAGNFGKRSYQHDFVPAAAGYTLPFGVAGTPHNFGGGDIYQKVSLKGSLLNPGKYTIVLQWQDAFYSQGQLGGTANDFDIYLVGVNNTTIGFNRNNIGGDPIEVLFFTVTADTEADILIVRAAGSTPVNLKYIGFRGELGFTDFPGGQSTIVGQANAAGAISVGAVLYTNTPAYGVSPPTIASFSSRGGMPINNVVRNKPDITAPNGVNTSVSFGSINYEGDAYPNFFGTSAAAPHAAATAALIIQSRKKFTGHVMTPLEVKTLLQTSALDMGGVGYDDSTGHGFVQPYVAVQTFAQPTPILEGLSYDPSITPTNLPTSPITLTIEGRYLTDETQVVVRGETVPTTVLNDSTATATVQPFIGNPPIQVYNPPIANGDGGYSNSILFFSVPKKNIRIVADNKTINYSDPLPAFTSSILVDDVPLSQTSLTLADLGLTNITYETPATAVSNIGIYAIHPVRDFDTTDPVDQAYLEFYNYSFADGALTVGQLPIQVTANDQSIVIGQALNNITFNYSRLDGQPLTSSLQEKISAAHKKYLADNILGVVNGYPGSPAISPTDLANMSTMVSYQALINARKFELVNGALVPISSGPIPFDAQYIVDVSAQSLRNYINDSATAILEASYPGVNSRSLISANALVKGTAQANLNGTLVQMVNGTLVQMVNSISGTTYVPVLNGNLVQMVNGNLVQLVNGVPVPIANGNLVQMVNGTLVQLVNGELVPIPNGTLVQLINGTLVQMVNGNLVQLVNGQNQPVLNGNLVQIVNGTLVQLVNGNWQPVANGNLVQMVNGTLVQLVNGNLVQMVNGTLVQLVNTLVQIINGNLVQMVNGVPYEIVNGTLVQLVNGQIQFVNSYQVGPGNNENAAVVIDANDINLQNGSVGPQFAANFVTGLGIGQQLIIPGSLINPNFKVTYVSGHLTVSPAAITIKANDRSKTYGEALTLGTTGFTITSGTLQAGDAITSVTLTSAGAPASALSTGSPYPIVPSAATGTHTGNYTITYTNGLLTVNDAPLTVKANDQVIFKGDRPPNYNGTITGLVNNDQASYNYTCPYTAGDLAGLYTITPVVSSFPRIDNYNITILTGTLYVNPKGSGAKKLRTYLDCVQEITNLAPGQFRYIAHFFCENSNSTPVYVPVGVDNKLVSANGASGFDGSNQPVLFMPGTTSFNVPFDGAQLTWEIRTFETNHKSSVASTASSSSGRCSFTTNRVSPEANSEVSQKADRYNLYPNPASGSVTIVIERGSMTGRNLMLYDAMGKSYAVKVNGRVSTNSMEIDISRLASGIYWIRYSKDGENHVFRFIKQ